MNTLSRLAVRTVLGAAAGLAVGLTANHFIITPAVTPAAPTVPKLAFAPDPDAVAQVAAINRAMRAQRTITETAAGQTIVEASADGRGDWAGAGWTTYASHSYLSDRKHGKACFDQTKPMSMLPLLLLPKPGAEFSYSSATSGGTVVYRVTFKARRFHLSQTDYYYVNPATRLPERDITRTVRRNSHPMLGDASFRYGRALHLPAPPQNLCASQTT